MAAKKRPQIDQIHAQKALIQSLETPLESPEKLNKQERYYFDLLVSNREKATWDSQDLILACKYAEEAVKINELNQIIKDEGLIIDSGTRRIAHPALAAVNQSLNQLQSITRMLGLSANARGLTGEFQQNRNEAEKKLVKQLEASDRYGDLI